jgi:hypothetical protein
MNRRRPPGDRFDGAALRTAAKGEQANGSAADIPIIGPRLIVVIAHGNRGHFLKPLPSSVILNADSAKTPPALPDLPEKRMSCKADLRGTKELN